MALIYLLHHRIYFNVGIDLYELNAAKMSKEEKEMLEKYAGKNLDYDTEAAAWFYLNKTTFRYEKEYKVPLSKMTYIGGSLVYICED